MNTILIKLALVATLIAATASGYTWWRNTEREIGRAEVRAQWKAQDQRDADLRASDGRQQRKFNDLASGKHLAVVTTLNDKLGAARAHISTLSGRACLDGATVRVLNAIAAPAGAEPGGAPTSEPAGETQASASDRDVSTALATCRAWYGQVSSQLNQILDIEDRRHPP